MPKAQVKPQGGWSDDRPAEELPLAFATNLQDIYSRDGAIGRSQSFGNVLEPPLAGPRWLLPNQTEATAFWLYASDQAVHAADIIDHSVITPVGFGNHAGEVSPFTGGTVNQFPVLNSTSGGPWYWDQIKTNVMVDLPDWPTLDRCESMRPFREFLIAMNITVAGTPFPDLLRWSDAAPPGDVPQSWVAAVGSQAGEISIPANPGALVDGAQLLDRFYVYKTSSTYVLTLIGGVFVFDQRPVFSTTGCLARDCIVEWRGQHFVLTDGDLIAHDGTNVQSIIKERLRREIFDDMDTLNFGNSFLALDRSAQNILICRPRRGEVYPSEAIVLALDNMSIGHQSMVSTGVAHAVDGLIDTNDTLERLWSDKTTTWTNDPTRWSDTAFSAVGNAVVLADPTGIHLQALGVGPDHDGVEIVAEIERTGITLGDANRRKLVRKVWPRFYGGGGNTVAISIGASDHPDVAPQYSPEQTFVIGTDRHVNVTVAGFFLAYKMRTNGGIEWRLPAFDLEFETMGEY